ncbi:MAG TPA: glycosyltransferase, partial [Bdellovibrionales bacterium]|nr:glycosyltransferase [Bdellovibrionales bacterium]
MKIRIYSPCFPHPITEGMHQIVADQMNTFLSMGFETELVVVLETLEDIENKASRELAELEARGLRLTSLAHPSRRRIAVLEKARRGFRVARSLVSQLASPEMHFYPPGLARARSSDEADLAIYHYSFAYSWLKAGPSRGEKKRVAYLHNLESELFELRASVARGAAERAVHRLNAAKLRAHERELARYCDEVWFLSPVDRKALLPWAHNKLMRLTPPTYDESLRQRRQKMAAIKGPQVREMRAGIIGGLDFLPNYHSAKWLLEEVAPRLAERGFTGKLVIAGKGAPEDLKALGARYSFVEFTGFVRDLEEYWSQLSLSLVPHVSGSGVRMKLLESVASGVPVLANSDAIRRLHPEVQKSPFVVKCERTEEWVQCLLEEKPFETRQALSGVPHNPGLTGAKI